MADLSMTINDKSILDLNADLIEYTFGTNKAEYTSYWSRLAPSPLITSLLFKERPLTVSLLVHGLTKTDALISISNITKELSNATIQFNDAQFLYDVILNGDPEVTWYGDPDTNIDGNNYLYLVKYTLSSGYGYLPVVSQTDTLVFNSTIPQAITVVPQGNVASPLNINARVVSGLTTDTGFYFGINKPGTFNILDSFVTNQFTFIGLNNGDTAEVDTETFKTYRNNVVTPLKFNGDFPVLPVKRSGESIAINVNPYAVMSDEHDITLEVTTSYKPRYV